MTNKQFRSLYKSKHKMKGGQALRDRKRWWDSLSPEKQDEYIEKWADKDLT